MTWLVLACCWTGLLISLLALWWRAWAIFGRGGDEDRHRADGAGAIANALVAVAMAALHAYPLAGFFALAAALFAWAWWRKRKRKRRKRSPKALGAKSRALIAALVRRAREAARPRPVLRPQPGGAS